MPSQRHIYLPFVGKTWEIGSGVSTIDGACVIVPVNQIGDMTDQKIGAYVRQLLVHAEMLAATEEAQYLLYDGAVAISRLERKDLAAAIDELRRFDGYSSEITEALKLARKRLDYLNGNECARAEITRNRDRIMRALAERDGNVCAKCGSDSSVEIDHIVPLSTGGTNDMENLQLLCRSCNASKGAKVADYR